MLIDEIYIGLNFSYCERSLGWHLFDLENSMCSELIFVAKFTGEPHLLNRPIIVYVGYSVFISTRAS
jgi:hypothetical protein